LTKDALCISSGFCEIHSERISVFLRCEEETLGILVFLRCEDPAQETLGIVVGLTLRIRVRARRPRFGRTRNSVRVIDTCVCVVLH
jgi:hypothetical protein